MKHTALAGLTGLLFTLPAYAQGTLPTDEVEVAEVEVSASELKPESRLKQPLSTASRLGLTPLETPASVEAVDADTLRRRGDVSIREAVSRTTGVSDISNLGVGNAFSVRGFSGNDSIGQAEDGVRLLTAAGTITFPSDTWGYERIEVLRGPASVLFGTGTVGGIINSIRKAPSREASVEALTGWGSRGEYRAGIGGTGAVGETGAFRIDASATGGNGYVDRGEHQSRKLMSGLQLLPADHVKLDFTFDHSEDSPTTYTGIPLRDGRIDSSLRKQNYNVHDSAMDFADDRLRAKLEWDISDTLKLSNLSYWFNSRRHWRNLEYYALDSAANTVERSGYTEIKHQLKQLGNRLELASVAQAFGLKNRWALGWETTRVDLRYIDNFYAGTDSSSTVPLKGFAPGYYADASLDPTIPEFKARTLQNALFAEDALDITERLKLTAGVRQDWINVDHQNFITGDSFDKDYSPFSYRLGAVFTATPGLALYGQYSQGSDPVSSIVSLRPGNRAFKLTTAHQTEVGIKHLLAKGKGEVTLALYHIAKEDILTRAPNNPQQTVQGGKQSSRGLELSAMLLPAAHWRVDANMAVLKARYDELLENDVSRAGNTPTDVPEKIANAWAYYQRGDWSTGVGARLVGQRYADNANTSVMPGYTVYDANIAWRANRQTTLRLYARNLGDKLYASTFYNTQQFILGPSRSLEFTAEISY
ncbi:MAG TPA: TonB-dependent receptor [Methylovorus sp.]|nr:TonB-dependent receptor [Methylovorus sp.]